MIFPYHSELDTPITEDWVQSLGFVKDNGDYAASFAGNWLLLRFEIHRIVCHIESDSTDDIVRLNNPKTRDDVLSLCKALGCKVPQRSSEASDG